MFRLPGNMNKVDCELMRLRLILINSKKNICIKYKYGLELI